MHRTRTRTRSCLAVAGGLAVVLSGCGSSTPTATTPSPAGTAVTGLSLQDGWVKAVPNGMTAMFGSLANATGQNLTVTSASSPVADMVQLHEVVMVHGLPTMRPKPGGFVVPAHGRHQLTPGGDQVMLMSLNQPIKPGATVTATLTLADGVTVLVHAIAKDDAGADTMSTSSGRGMSMNPSP
jgi:periplasmic copper chaperone A